MTAKRPNILFLMADQMAVPSLPFHGHPLVKTPHLSRLAAEGVVFDSAYCNSPLCAPSRFALMAGQLPSRSPRATCSARRSTPTWTETTSWPRDWRTAT